METSRKRIIDFIEIQGIKPQIFLEKTGLKKGFVDRSHQESGATDVFLSKILDVYPEINAEWLLTGKGSMLKSINQTTGSNEVPKLKEELIEVMRENRKLNTEIAWLKKELDNFQNIDRNAPKPTTTKLKTQKSGN